MIDLTRTQNPMIDLTRTQNPMLDLTRDENAEIDLTDDSELNNFGMLSSFLGNPTTNTNTRKSQLPPKDKSKDLSFRTASAGNTRRNSQNAEIDLTQDEDETIDLTNEPILTTAFNLFSSFVGNPTTKTKTKTKTRKAPVQQDDTLTLADKRLRQPPDRFMNNYHEIYRR